MDVSVQCLSGLYSAPHNWVAVLCASSCVQLTVSAGWLLGDRLGVVVVG